MALNLLTENQFQEEIKNRKVFAVGGFRRSGTPQQLLRLIRETYNKSKQPDNITLIFSSTPTDPGVDILAKEGLLDCVIGSFLGSIPEIRELIQSNRIKGYSLPQGQISLLFREISRGSPGLISKVGMFTFVDPNYGGGRLNEKTTTEIVKRIQLFGEDYLLYTAPKIDVALLRGSACDSEGNISMEAEPIKTEFLSMAQAAKNSGGKVFVQVLKVERERFDPQKVDLPAFLVDGVIVCKNPNTDHRQTNRHQYFEGYTSKLVKKTSIREEGDVLYKKLIAKRVLKRLENIKVLNLGQGLPELVGTYMKKYPEKYDPITICLESGVIGGRPERRPDFGVTINPTAFLTQDNQFVLFDGGFLDMAILSFAQVDREGRVNVSRIGDAEFGGGGFMDIVHRTKQILFVGSFTAKGLEIGSENHTLNIYSEGEIHKFVQTVDQLTFTPQHRNNNQKIMVITERCTFKIENGSVTLIEIVKGVNLEKDIFEQMDFTPKVSENLEVVDSLGTFE